MKNTRKMKFLKFRFYFSENIWPKDELPEYEHAFKDLGRLIVSVGELVAQQCDEYGKI